MPAIFTTARLGLATALGVVKQHQGHIDVSSEIGKGSTFHIFLPVSGEAAETAAVQVEAPVREGNETILVVEDHDGLREMSQQMLETFGYTVVVAANGEEAVQKFEANYKQISLALMDVVMPKISGPDLYRKLCKIKPGLPAIFASGYAEPNVVLDALIANSPVIFLTKPYSPKTLARRIREQLEREKNRPSPTAS